MTIHSLFPASNSYAAIAQTLARVTNVAAYLEPLMESAPDSAHLAIWQDAVRNGDTQRIIEELKNFGPLPARHLDMESAVMLRVLAGNDARLRAELQSSAEHYERMIGVAFPLRMAVHAEPVAASLPERGIALYLGSSRELPRDALNARSSLQLFSLKTPTLAPYVEEDTDRVERSLRGRGHSPKVRGHFAQRDIEELAALELQGGRVTPLSFPNRVELSSRLTRVGRFTFLGLNQAGTPAQRESLLSSIERHRHLVDVLVLGALSARQDGFADAAIATLKPRIALLPEASAAAVHSFGYTTVFPVGASPALLEMHPIAQSIEIRDGRSRASISLNRQNRILDVLEKIRPDVTRDLVRSNYGQMAADGMSERTKGAWRWARLTMNGAVPMALRYLLLLDFDPNRFAQLWEREEALARVIDEMTDPLGYRDTVPDHVWALKETLLRSGLLARRG